MVKLEFGMCGEVFVLKLSNLHGFFLGNLNGSRGSQSIYNLLTSIQMFQFQTPCENNSYHL